MPTGPLLLEKNRPPQQALEIIVAHFRRVNHPVYLGIAALEVGWSLSRTQQMFDELVVAGTIRQQTSQERTTCGYPVDANTYVLA